MKLVVQTSFIGDVILTTPLIMRLAQDDDVHVVTTVIGATVLRGHPSVARLTVYDKRGSDRGAIGFTRTARAIRGAAVAYLCQGSSRSAVLALAAGCGARIGFDTSDGRWLYTDRVTYRDDWHHSRRLLSLGDMTAASSTAIVAPRLYPGDGDVAQVDELLEGVARPLVALAPGSVWKTKRWPRYAELARLLAEDHDIAIVGGEADASHAVEIARGLRSERVVDATGKLSLLGSAELVRRAVALVTNDSAAEHLASAVGTPTIAIFGPTVPSFGFGPLAPRSATAGIDSLECRPCDRHGPRACPLKHWRCMTELSAMQIHEMVRNVIAKETAS